MELAQPPSRSTRSTSLATGEVIHHPTSVAEPSVAPSAFDNLAPGRAALACMAIALLIVVTAQLVFTDFFYIDDAQNQNLPFYREMGRLWLSGDWPILTTTVLLGGNILVDMVLSPFSPQTILTSLVAATTDSIRIPVFLIAWVNTSLVALGAYWLARTFAMRSKYALLFGFLSATAPVYLYMFAASWWNLAAAYAWFVVALAALLQFRLTPRVVTFIVATVSTCFLFLSQGTQYQLAWVLCYLIVMAMDFHSERNWRKTAHLLMIGTCTFLIVVIPVMSEYLVARDLIIRVEGFFSRNLHMMPSWGQMLNFFNPFYQGYMVWWGGYRTMPVAMGYAGIILLLPLCFVRYHPVRTLPSRLLPAFLVLAIILCLSPTQIGPVTGPVRYLPLLGLVIALLLLLQLDRGRLVFNQHRRNRFLLLIGLSFIAQAFSAEDQILDIGRIPFLALFLLLCALIYRLTLSTLASGGTHINVSLLAAVSFLAWLGMLQQNPTFAGGHWPAPTMGAPLKPELPAVRGYTVGLCATEAPPKERLADLGTGQYLHFGIRSINGYSPVGHNGLSRFFPYVTSHGYFNTEMTLLRMSEPVRTAPGYYVYDLFNVERIFACSKDVPYDVQIRIENAGMIVEPSSLKGRLVIHPARPRTTEGSLTYQGGGAPVRLAGVDGMRHEWFDVSPDDKPRTLIFARLYWPGYRATLDGRDLAVSNYRNTLVTVDLPAGSAGRLDLRYQPVSWQHTRWVLLAGLVLFGLSIGWVMTTRRTPPAVASTST